MVRFRSMVAVRALPPVLVATALAAAIAIAPVALWSASAGADSSADTTTFTVGTPQLSSITNNGTSLAPWNNWQGDSSASEPSTSELFPTYTPAAGDPTISAGGVTYPNLSTYGGSGADGTTPYPDGTVGTPGPLDDYCGTGNNTTESAGAPVRQPAGEALPMSPYYFPHIVSNPDGSLTGYFDWRPKDADEAIVVARSTDNGVQWTYEGEALEQNPNYCPNADINDDGEGHPNVLTIGGNSYLYTLQRAAGDNVGVGLLVHSVDPSAANPLAGVASTEQVGLDADSFATATDTVSSTSSSINVAQTLSGDLVNGNPTSPEELVPGPFVDLTQTPTPTAADVITCTGVAATSLTGCTTTGASISVASNDLIEQVVATVKTAAVIPAGPNTSTGDGGLATLAVVPVNALTMTILNNNAPNRVYVDGEAVYCDQSNANPTTKIEDCTTGAGGASLSAAVGAPITMDPVVPSTAEQTNGLVSPDGIVGVLPTYPGVPAGATAVMYTEKELNYFIAGDTSSSAAASTSTAFSLSFLPSNTESQDLPATISTADPVTIQAGVTPTTGSPAIEAMTCTGLTTAVGTPGTEATDKFTGCLLTAGETAGTIASSSYLATADGANTSEATLAQTGEGSTKSTAAAKLFKNNEDLEILRVAYTTDGVNFSSAGLDNNGIISGSFSGENTGATAGQFNPATPTNTDVTGTSYTDISNPEQTASPSNLNAYAGGNQDATEMRWVGSTGTIVTNPNGTIGLFLNGAFAADGDSDAFNQIFYTESTNGETWTTPVALVSTDYTFAASAAQEANPNSPLGISAYYSGRAYNPTVVQNPDGTLTMLFSGYRTPGTASIGSAIGTNSTDPYTPSATDPNLYRTILVTTLTESTTPLISTTTNVSSSPASPVDGQPVTYTATVTTSGNTTPTGSVTFSDGTGTLCQSVALSDATPDTAACATTYNGSAATATYAGDTNYATSTSSLGFAPDPPTGFTGTPGNGQAGFTWVAPTNTGGSPITGYTVSDGSGDSCTASSTATGCTISNLTNGTSYTFSVTATNATGASAPSTPATLTPFTFAGAPSITSVSAGNSAITIDWSPPGSDGGSAITGYTVDAIDGANPSDSVTDVCGPASDDSPAASCSTTTLVDGESYTFEVAALNGAGTGPFSAPSSTATFIANPESPSIASVTPSDASLTVKWTAPPSDGGSPVTGYTVSETDGTNATTTDVCPASDSSTALQCVVSNLTNGEDYTFEVAAINAAGTGPFSSPSTPAAPYTEPGAPTITSGTPGNGAVELDWSAPSNDGGNAVSGYTVTALDTKTSVATTNACPGSAASTTTSCTVSNLTNGVSYTFEVAAINSAGMGAFSSTSSPFTPYGTPSAPGNPSAKAGVLSAHVTWTVPSNNGGSAITGYTVAALNETTSVTTADACGPASDGSTSLSCTANGLTAGDAYTFSVAAINAGGPGTFSGSTGRVVPLKATLSVAVTGSQSYHSSSPTFTTTTSAPAGDSFSGALVCRTVSPGKPISSSLAVGTYTIASQSCSGLSLSGSTASDYAIAYSGGAFSVTSTGLTVTVTGSQSYRSSSPSFTTSSSAPAGERFTGTLRCTSLSSPAAAISPSLAVGSYTINGASCSGLTLSGQNGAGFSITYVGGTFSVAPATVNVVVNGSQLYRSSSPSFTTSSNAPSGDHFTGTLACTKVTPSKSISSSLPVGAYEIDGASCSGLSLAGSTATDYSIAYSGGVFVVRP